MFWNDTSVKFLVSVVVIATVTSCNTAKFEAIEEAAKSKLLSERSVFETDNGGSDPEGGYAPETGSNDPFGGSGPVAGGTDPQGSAPGGRQPGSVDYPISIDPSTGLPKPPQPGKNPGGTTKPPAAALPKPPVATPPVVALPPPPVAPPPAVAPTQPNSYAGGIIPAADIPLNPTEIPLQLICSNNETSTKGENLRSTTNLKVEVVQYQGAAPNFNEVSRCVEDSVTAAQLISGKTLTFSKCAPKGGLLLNGAASPAQISAGATDYFSVDFIADNAVSLLSSRVDSTRQNVHLLYDINGTSSAAKPAGFSTTPTHQALCDRNASPLFVDMRSEFERTQKFSLKAPWDGVLFDILGKNADPVAHTPNRISWFENSAMAYIVLPNNRGQVLGIDQLFGDNTLGPDGKFAADGYAALAKYDANKDNLITSEDPVYANLKIWQDKNHDGKATASELKSFNDAKINVIDLQYDSNFSEKDKYGNTIKYKSVAKMANGEYRLVFDVWFELNLYKARERFIQLSSR